jgi:hypothetical protein
MFVTIDGADAKPAYEYPFTAAFPADVTIQVTVVGNAPAGKEVTPRIVIVAKFVPEKLRVLTTVVTLSGRTIEKIFGIKRKASLIEVMLLPGAKVMDVALVL